MKKLLAFFSAVILSSTSASLLSGCHNFHADNTIKIDNINCHLPQVEVAIDQNANPAITNYAMGTDENDHVVPLKNIVYLTTQGKVTIYRQEINVVNRWLADQLNLLNNFKNELVIRNQVFYSFVPNFLPTTQLSFPANLAKVNSNLMHYRGYYTDVVFFNIKFLQVEGLLQPSQPSDVVLKYQIQKVKITNLKYGNLKIPSWSVITGEVKTKSLTIKVSWLAT
ncbi:hypothetical protein [Spiroplasma eriocheiris]|uniref:Lipoprotein n=1 Tax=Spiroplasma eriocheiris TaxID=315358 RepID=A0A0H3XKS6_9MOLU|nr:hypothetical protein [Spiroplasma eriocheiris]AHF57597.1 hypothetical protein SPE_0469 [Spiroplasma eriocheiris CCTCC M 207170]AKM54054.1 hypothetical protein SERIO_v1c04750 [Spiroplasma eriocheiris]